MPDATRPARDPGDRRGGKGQPSTSHTGAGGQRHGRDAELSRRLGELARTLEEQVDVDQTLGAIVAASVETVPGAQHASISSAIGRQVRTRASTGALPVDVDLAQYETGQGPCLDSLHHQRTVRLADLPADGRWPGFARRAGALGVGSMLAVQLYVHGDGELGALNLLSTEHDAFDDESERVALLFAAHAAVAMAGAQEQHELHLALDTRDVIGQAKGILMERFKITGDQAFTLLVRASQQSNTKLRVLADELARSGSLPDV